jgi:hypothetical protein
VSALGLGGLLAGRVRLDRPVPLTATITVLTLASWVLTVSRNLLVVTTAQFTVALVVVMVSIYVSRVLHDAVPSTVRSGVVSGIGALSWITFLPVSLVFGQVSKHHGVEMAAWMITAVALIASAVLVKLATSRDDEVVPDDVSDPTPTLVPEPVAAVGCTIAA